MFTVVSMTWIKLHRDILDSDVFASQKLLKIWIWCLCKANFKDRTVPLKVGKGETLVKIKRGQFLFGRFKAEEDLCIDGSTIYKAMKKLEEMNNISIQSNNQYSIVTICNYSYYQKNDIEEVAADEQVSSSQVTAEGQPSNTPKKVKKEGEGKEGKSIYTSDFLVFWSAYPKKIGKGSAYKAWKKIKSTKELLTEMLSAIKKQINSNDWKKENGQYIPHPSTWLNTNRWEDELPPKSKGLGFKYQ